MKRGEPGFSILETMIASALAVIIGGSALMSISLIGDNTEKNSNRILTISQVDSAGDWISRDVQTAEGISIGSIENPDDFLVLSWPERDYVTGTYISHTVTYYFTGMSDGIGTLNRNHLSTAGANEQTAVASHIYYNAANPDHSSGASLQETLLTVKLCSIYGDARETKEYYVTRRTRWGY